MKADINAIVQDLKKVRIEQIVFEAVTNAIQANATKIQVHLKDINDSTLPENEAQLIQLINVIDDGHGFTAKDIESFQTYRSTYKKKQFGSKGVGRFLYLKLFKNVSIQSLNKNINFSVSKDVEIFDTSTKLTETTVTISNARDSYTVNKKSFVKQIQQHFLPYFKLIKQTNKHVSIKVFFNNTLNSTLNSDETPEFVEDQFKVHGHQFNISYLLNHDAYKKVDGVYCAGNRVVTSNSNLEQKIQFKGFNGIHFFYLITSDYLEENLNDERDEFTIKPKQTNHTSTFKDLSWEDIHSALSEKLKQICIQNNINIERQAREYLHEALNKAPYLGNYLHENEYSLPPKDLIRKAEKALEKDKEKLRNSINKTDEEYQFILNRVVQTELAEYVFDRQKTIETLRALVKNSDYEEKVHNLFMPQHTNDEKMDYRTNNLWLFDDRFMSYDKIFSEHKIKEVFPKLSENIKRPDILSIYSNSYIKEEITDIVIIEFKRPDESITPAGAKEQLQTYSRYINDSETENKIRIWGYAFLKFDDETVFNLENDDYNSIPTHSEYPIFYRYFEKANIVINVLDYESLAYDAESRNQTFLNILKGNHY